VRSDDFSIDGLPAAMFGGDRVELGVRPQDIDPLPLDGRDAQTDATGRVAILEPIGATTVVHLRLDNGSDALTRVVVPSDAKLGIDDRIGIRLRRDRLHLFDSATQRRIDA
jgi:ABC-type sugar transport system ATPase subunit